MRMLRGDHSRGETGVRGMREGRNRAEAVSVLRRQSGNDRNTTHTERNGLHAKMQKSVLLRKINKEMGL